MKKIIYRTNEFFERDKPQEFSEYEDDYELCEDSESPNYDKVIVVGKTNIQEKIQSSENCALNKILDKYLDQLPNMAIEVDNSETFENYKPDLADLGAEYSRVEELKEKYGLDDSLGYEETIEELQRRKASLDSLILEAQKKSQKVIKEDKKNEKTQDEI